MSLRVWLPLNGNLNNQGTSGVTVTNSGATVDSTGKIGQCYRFNKNAYLQVPGSVVTNFTTEASFCLWLKLNSFNVSWDTYVQIGIDTTPWTSYRMGLLRNSSNSNLVFAISDGSTSTQTTFTTPNLSTGIWYHIACVYKLGHCLIYVNGALHADNTTTVVPKFSDVTKIMIGGLSGSYKSDSYVNDFRIYDHCLSPKEVKEISKGLVVHYPLDGSGKGGDNLLSNTNTANINLFGYSEQTGGSTKTIEYDGGTPCIKVTRNDTAHSGWSYMWHNNLKHSLIKTSTTYTLSFDAIASGSGSVGFSGFMNGNATNNMSQSTQIIQNTFNSTNWSHLIFRTTTKSSFDDLAIGGQQVYMSCGFMNSINVWIKIKNFKVEEGDIDTPWCPNSTDTAYATLGYNSTTEIDTSGFGNHGTKTKSMNINTDTPRNNSCTIFDGTNDCILTPFNSIIKDSNYTISVWVKKSVIGTDYYQTIFGGPSGFELEARNGQTNEAKFVTWNWGKVSYAYNFNQWYHFVFVHSSSDSKLYIDGTLVGTGSTATIPSGNYYVGSWRDTTSQNFEGQMSDFRIYATALSADDVKELYQSAASVDNEGNLFCYEIKEPSSVNHSAVMKTGEVTATGDTVNPNMILNTPRSYVSGNYNAYLLNLNENLVAGEKYTLQYWDADVSHTGKTSTQLSIATYWGGGMNVQAEFKIPTGHSDYLVKTFTAQKNAQPSDGNRMWFNLYNSPGDASGTRYMHIGKWKLEKGEVATPYVPPAFKTFDSTIYTEPDGSRWIKIVRHSHPDTTKFVSSDVFTAYTYKAADVWFCGALCNEVTSGYWELMVKQALTSGGTETKYRWIQQTNPMAGSYNETVAANIQRNTSSGYSTANYGGIYKFNSNTYLVGNNGASGNWFGAFGCWTAYNGGIPGFFGGAVTTGYMDLYLRIDTAVNNADCDAGFIEEPLPPAKVGNNWVQSHEFIER